MGPKRVASPDGVSLRARYLMYAAARLDYLSDSSLSSVSSSSLTPINYGKIVRLGCVVEVLSVELCGISGWVIRTSPYRYGVGVKSP